MLVALVYLWTQNLARKLKKWSWVCWKGITAHSSSTTTTRQWSEAIRSGLFTITKGRSWVNGSESPSWKKIFFAVQTISEMVVAPQLFPWTQWRWFDHTLRSINHVFYHFVSPGWLLFLSSFLCTGVLAKCSKTHDNWETSTPKFETLNWRLCCVRLRIFPWSCWFWGGKELNESFSSSAIFDRWLLSFRNDLKIPLCCQ